MPDNTQTNLETQLNILAQTDIFQLIGIKDLKQEKRLEMLAKMQELLINDFFTNDLPRMLNEQEIKEFEKMQDEDVTADQIVKALKIKIPDIDDRLYEKSIDFKQRFVINQLDQNVQVIEKKLEMLKNGTFPQDKIPNGNLNEEILKVNKQKVKMKMVLHHYKAGQWAEGFAILTNGGPIAKAE